MKTEEVVVPSHPCPCCGHAINSYPLHLTLREVSPLSSRLVECLGETPGEFVESVRIAAYIWTGADGGPINYRKSLSEVAKRANKILRPRGWQVTGRRGPLGGGYKIETVNIGEYNAT